LTVYLAKIGSSCFPPLYNNPLSSYTYTERLPARVIGSIFFDIYLYTYLGRDGGLATLW
jgi:hypothetical protein